MRRMQKFLNWFWLFYSWNWRYLTAMKSIHVFLEPILSLEFVAPYEKFHHSTAYQRTSSGGLFQFHSFFTLYRCSRSSEKSYFLILKWNSAYIGTSTSSFEHNLSKIWNFGDVCPFLLIVYTIFIFWKLRIS